LLENLFSLHYQKIGSSTLEIKGGDYKSGNVFATNAAGNFGPVCDDDWDNLDAIVVCRQLGFSSGMAYQGSRWGQVPTDFVMDDVQCTRYETHLYQCANSCGHNCAATEGAGVICN
jgi:hypothetical protein